MRIFNRVQLTILLALLISISLVACQQKKDTKKVKLTYVEWSSEIASANIVKAVLEELGYKVDIVPVSAAAMWQAIASGEADGIVAAWLHTTHAHYLTAVKDKVDDLGPNLKGTRVGLVVPEYVTITSIEELNANADKFKKQIIGIDPGAGLMTKTERVMKEYALTDYKLIEGSGATMTAALGDAITNQQWIVVTGWTPHWMFSRWKLKYLVDPKNVFDTLSAESGKKEYISTIVRKGLKEDMPEVYRVLDNFFWEPADMEKVMVWNEERNADPYENAKRWVKENREKANCWIAPADKMPSNCPKHE